MNNGKRGSVQASFIPVREVGADYLALDAPQKPGRRELRAVIEVSGLNYLLKSPEERRQVNDVFQSFLAGLNHPLQIVMRVLPVDLEGYLAYFHPPLCAPQELHTQLYGPHALLWHELAEVYCDFLRQISLKRTLVERRFYVIVPADATGLRNVASWKAFWSPTQRRAEQEETMHQAHQRLHIRCFEIMHRLQAMGLSVHQLGRDELLALEYSCLAVERARTLPLPLEAPYEPASVISDEWERTAVSHADRQIRTLVPIQEATPPSSTPQKRKSRRQRAKASSSKEEGRLWTELADLLAPAAVVISPEMLQVETEYIQALSIFDLPRVVRAGWLNQLAYIDELMDVSWLYIPRTTDGMMHLLKRKHFEMRSSHEIDLSKGRYPDPGRSVALQDIEDLMQRLASGQERMVELSIHLLVRASSKRALRERAHRIRATLQGMLLGVRPCYFEQDKGFRSCLPHARNELRREASALIMASREASTTFPFLTQTLFHDRGILEGVTRTNELVILDWWHRQNRNANRLIVAASGAGKSFKSKLDIFRMYLLYIQKLAAGTVTTLPFQLMVIDIEREFVRTVEQLRGQRICFAPGSQHRLNPFDLPHAPSGRHAGEDVLTEKITDLQALLDLLLAEKDRDGVGRLDQREKALLDKALYFCYQEKGITKDPSTHHRYPPLLKDLQRILESGVCGHDETSLALRLARYVSGSLSGLFSGYTNVPLEENPVICFDIRDLSQELHPIAFFLIADYVWNASFGSIIPRQLIVDEMASLYRFEEGKWFLETLAQRARKHYLGVTFITQHPKNLQDSSILANCATQILMAQETTSLPLIAEIFHLSQEEISLLRSFGKGEALLLTGGKRLAVRFEASELEYTCCTSDPVDREQEAVLAPPEELEASTGEIPESREERSVTLQASLIEPDQGEGQAKRRTNTGDVTTPPSFDGQSAHSVKRG